MDSSPGSPINPAPRCHRFNHGMVWVFKDVHLGEYSSVRESIPIECYKGGNNYYLSDEGKETDWIRPNRIELGMLYLPSVSIALLSNTPPSVRSAGGGVLVRSVGPECASGVCVRSVRPECWSGLSIRSVGLECCSIYCNKQKIKM